MNEFGEIGIDSRIIAGEHTRIIELTGGCVCCELAGEFIAAVTELLMRYRPDMIVVEATGVAEADALVYEVEDELPEVRLDSVIYVAGRWELDAFDADRTELALFDLLQELIFYKDAEELLLRVTGVDIATGEDRIVLSAEAQGEKINSARHRLLVDVKAVTLHCFKVERIRDGWSATVVLDI